MLSMNRPFSFCSSHQLSFLNITDSLTKGSVSIKIFTSACLLARLQAKKDGQQKPPETWG
jgi:hypothetical protein